MIVVFNCPQCRRTLRADDYFSGKKIQCRTCKTILFVPGAPPVRDGHAPDAEIASPAPENSDLHEDAGAASQGGSHLMHGLDTSYGIASLCLAVFSFLCGGLGSAIIVTVLAVALMPIVGKYSVGICFLAAAYAMAPCYLFSRHGYNFAIKQEDFPGGQGYAAAGKLINKFLMKTYISFIVLLLLGAVVTLIFAQYFDPMRQANKMLDQLKGIQQQFGP